MHQVNIVISGFFGLVYNFPCAIRFYCHWSVFLWSIIVSSPCNSVFQYAIQSLVDFHIQLLFSRFLIAIWYLPHYIYIMHCAKPRHSAIRKSRESKALPILYIPSYALKFSRANCRAKFRRKKNPELFSITCIKSNLHSETHLISEYVF